MELDSTLRIRLAKYLTSDVLNRLSNSDGIQEATQRLNSLHKALSSFLPAYITRNPDILAEDYGNLTPGTFMFADVSGFTALSEKLMATAGAEGIEILTQIFNDYFATMLEILAKSDGALLKFAGDAMLTFFPANENEDEVVKAIKTGLRMQRKMAERYQPIQHADLQRWFGDHDLQLTMSIGISQGELFEALVGNIAQRDHMIMGRLPGLAMDAEEVGERDEVIVDSAIHAAYADQLDMQHLQDDFYQVIDNLGDDLGDYEFSMPAGRRRKASFLFAFDEEQQLEDLEKTLTKVELIARFVSSEIVNKLVVKGDHIESENRLTTVVFVHFTGVAELLEHWGKDRLTFVTAILSRYYGIMQRVIARHGGSLYRSDPYKLGSKLLIGFGAPVAHPDDPDRAVATTLEMNRELEKFNQRLRSQFPEDAHLFPFIKQRMGIAQGNAFAGEVGWRQRREYTVMGDDVNLAARLMSKAEFGQVVIHESIWRRVHPYFKTEALPLFQAKGKQEPVRSFAVLDATAQTNISTSDTPFVGREALMLTLKEQLDRVRSEEIHRKSNALSGEAGVGKTRLAQQVADVARSLDFSVAWVTCRTQNTRKTTLASIVIQLLGIERDQQQLTDKLTELGLEALQDVFKDLLFDSVAPASQKQSRRRTSTVRQNIFEKLSSEETIGRSKNEVAQMRQQLISALDSNTAPTHVWSSLEMSTSLTDAMIQLLSAYTAQHHTLLIVDDIHRENSRALKVLRNIYEKSASINFMLLITYDEAHDPALNIPKVTVSDLPEEETYLIASSILGASELGERLSQFIWEGSKGRVVFIESLLQALKENNQLDEQDGILDLKPDANTEALPSDIRGLIISRLDRLSSDARLVLRAAAVLDDQFTFEMLKYVCEIEHFVQIEVTLGNLLHLQLLEPTPEGNFQFKHGVTQQAVYDEMSRTQRQRLHERAAEYFVNDEGEQNIAICVNHLVKAGKQQDAISKLVHMGETTEAKNKQAALEYYQMALDIEPKNVRLIALVRSLQY